MTEPSRRLCVRRDVLRLAAVALFVLSACTPSQVVPSPSLAPASSPAPGAARAPADVKVNLYDRGLSLEIPARWTWNAAVGLVNRATSRYFLAANGPLTDLPVVPGNGDVDASVLPTGRVVVAVEVFCRLACTQHRTLQVRVLRHAQDEAGGRGGSRCC